MYESTAHSEQKLAPATRRARNRWAIAIVLVMLAGVAGYLGWLAFQPAAAPAGSGILSASELAERHGLAVRLVGVTAGGGMVDFRLKILDAGRAQAFLQDPASLPVSMVTENGTELLAADQVQDEVAWEEGGILFILLPNTGGAVQPGHPVSISFGNTQVEPVAAQ